MNINKAIKKQNKSLIRFVLMMGFIFLLLPSTLIYYKVYYLYMYIYLLIIEMIIIYGVLWRIDREFLRYTNQRYKITIKNGLFTPKVHLISDKVVLVHMIELKDDCEIAIILKSKFRNKKIKSVDSKFLNKSSEMEKLFNEIKLLHPEKYTYMLINRGKKKKYKLLYYIYKNCVYAAFTDSTIAKIKAYSK